MPQRALFWEYPHYSKRGGAPASAVRQGEWKLIRWFENDKYELHNLANDSGEKNDLSDKEA